MHVTVCSAILIATIGAAGADGETKRLIDVLAGRAQGIKTWQARMVYSLHAPASEAHVECMIRCERPSKFRIDDMAAGPAVIRAICDGHVMWWFHPETNTVTRTDIRKAEKATGANPALSKMIDIADPFRGALVSKAKYVGLKEAAGRKQHVFEAPTRFPFKTTGGPKSGRVRLWICPDDGILLRQEVFGPSGEEVLRITFADVVLHGQFDDDTFTCAPPKGARVLDDTGQAIPGPQSRKDNGQ